MTSSSGWSKQFFDVAADERVQIPELVNFDKVRVIARERTKSGSSSKNRSATLFRCTSRSSAGELNAVFLAKFVAEQAGGFVHVMDEPRVFRRDFRDVMVNDDPVLFVHARFKGEVRDPRGAFAQFALFPVIVMVRFQRHVPPNSFRASFCSSKPATRPSRSLSWVIVFLMAKWTWRCLFKGVRTKPSNSINQHEYCRRL
jgi:hypothetical protein